MIGGTRPRPVEHRELASYVGHALTGSQSTDCKPCKTWRVVLRHGHPSCADSAPTPMRSFDHTTDKSLGTTSMPTCSLLDASERCDLRKSEQPRAQTCCKRSPAGTVPSPGGNRPRLMMISSMERSCWLLEPTSSMWASRCLPPMLFRRRPTPTHHLQSSGGWHANDRPASASL